MTKNDIVTAEITAYGNEGLGVCRVNGQALFVRGAARGDVCDIRVLKSTVKASWGKVERLITPSPHRIENDCAAFPACGGCDLRHVDYQEELRFKRDKVEQALRRIGGIELPVEDVVAAESVSGYRNKAIIPVGVSRDGGIEMGFYRSRTHDIISCGDCAVNAPDINLCAGITRRFLDENGADGVKHLMVRAVSGGVQAALITNGRQHTSISRWVEMLREDCADIKSILLIENTRSDNVLLDGKITTLWGSLTLTEHLGGMDFELHPFAFAQVNSKQAEKLYDIAAAYAAPSRDEIVADLYCGTGTLTLWLAKHAESVYGVEIEPGAVECAVRNAARNSITNARFILGDAGVVKLPETPSVIVIDPPRSGLSQEALNAVCSYGARRLVYVSCDPATLARDIKLLTERGFTARSCCAVDMFPRTRHVESVVLLSRME